MSVLFAPARHAPLAAAPWSDGAARATLEGLVAGLEDAYRGPELLWPNHLDDLAGDPDVPLRTLYLGAGGIVWALARLARTGRAAPRIDLPRLAAQLVEDWREASEFTSLYPGLQPSLLMGESGLRLLRELLAPDAANAAALATCIRANAENPTRELLWGSPGTMLAAAELAGPGALEPWASAWREDARWLLAEWRDELWVQDMYGKEATYVGAGHGFAGNVHALLRGAHLLEPAERAEVERRATAVVERLAVREGALAQWPPLLGVELPPEQTQHTGQRHDHKERERRLEQVVVRPLRDEISHRRHRINHTRLPLLDQRVPRPRRQVRS